ncbi:MAG TPA: hypothetical protein DCE42_14770 [Myxococcales bacterium]|nr:hypothetical protein [Deltaproteobacteria bacterium]MBU54532.1 hypothetical protein [Deltaproteobacteria bacterium]HAA56025.1 hypothetical protein [Myxococcales bacterium]
MTRVICIEWSVRPLQSIGLPKRLVAPCLESDLRHPCNTTQACFVTSLFLFDLVICGVGLGRTLWYGAYLSFVGKNDDVPFQGCVE